MNKLLNLFIYFLNIPLYLLGRLIPKDKKIWIFGAWFGEKYADNSKYLFEYVNNHYPEIRAIWLTKNKDVYNLLESKGYEVYYNYSVKAILLGLRAKYSIFVLSNNSDNMMFLNNINTKLIQLWHGSPIKKIGFDDRINSNNQFKLKIKYFLFPFLNEKYDLFVATGDKDSKVYSTAFNKSNIQSVGFPRNDVFQHITRNNKIARIIYMPTHRNEGELDVSQLFANEINTINHKLAKMNIILYVKLHFYHLANNNFKDKSNIMFIKDKDIQQDIYSFLPQTDILITDYSSVYFDYLLTNRPIIFAPFDYEKYITKDRELYYDYDEVTPGPKCHDWEEVLIWIEKFKNDGTLFSKEREEIKNKFHTFQDGKNCERVYNEIIKL